MKKVLSIVLSLVLALSCMAICATAAKTEETLKFDENGNFKIVMINDFQDRASYKQETVDFVEAVLDAEQPDLVVFAGDQLCDVYPFASANSFKEALAAQLKPLEDRGIPFMVTLGNHDHDREETLSEAGQYEIYNSYSMCWNTENGPEGDPFTCYMPIMSSDGSKVAMNVYMMDSNNTNGIGSYTGINETQLAWYNNVCAELKAANGGETVPALNFQHVPVKEIYSLLEVCEWNTPGAIYARRDGNWYVTAEGVEGECGEAPCSEDFDVITGQYQAWVENGDVVGAFFAHDHVNNFVGKTEDGITLGYNGGTGFRSYGIGGNRSVRVFNINENDVAGFETHLVTYNEIMGTNISSTLSDFMSPAILTDVMKIVYALFGWLIKLTK